jgi:hypothetical protein
MRSLSIVLYVMAFVFPVSWYGIEGRKRLLEAPEPARERFWVEVSVLGDAVIYALLFFLLAAFFSVLSYVEVPKPRPLARRIELAIISSPIALVFALIFLVGIWAMIPKP